MAHINQNYTKLPGAYLFAEIARRVTAYAEANPGADLIRMGIGDVTRPLVPAVIEALHKATDEMATFEGFRGYGPDGGYDFLRRAIAAGDYHARGVQMDADEVFVSDGAKSDCANIGEIFAADSVVAVCDPVYPVYVDTNAMMGRAGEYDAAAGRWTNVCYMPCTAENDFTPALPDKPVDLIYLCYPNNPTGTAATKEQLQVWVDYANRTGAVILFDSAYKEFIVTPGVPHSIYEIDGAQTCAIELRSFSKTAGFTGTRCGYTVVPKALMRDGVSLHSLWARRQGSKFNGTPYIVQRAAEAVYTEEGQRQIRETIAYYQKNAAVILAGLTDAGLSVFGGVDAPYVWAKTPAGFGSWELFDHLLKNAGVVVTPGAGFGPAGEGYIRLTAFGDAEATGRAMNRIRAAL